MIGANVELVSSDWTEGEIASNGLIDRVYKAHENDRQTDIENLSKVGSLFERGVAIIYVGIY
jgi:hypothetical protein